MAIVSKEFRRLRAMKMIEGKVLENKTNPELAEQFHCSLDTVERTLSWAKRADIFSTYEDKIVQELIPLAHTAIKDALLDGNAKIAVEVFKGLNLLKSGPAAAGTAARSAEDDLAAYIATKRDKAQLVENTIDGSIVPSALLEESTHDRDIQSPAAGNEASDSIRASDAALPHSPSTVEAGDESPDAE